MGFSDKTHKTAQVDLVDGVDAQEADRLQAAEKVHRASAHDITLLFMRHPETQGNLQHRYVGQVDSPLSEKGARQRGEAEQALTAWKPGRIICSPLERCRAIAEPVAEACGLNLEIDHRVIEMNFGKLEGRTAQEIIELGYRFPWESRDDEWDDDDECESLRQINERVGGFVDELINTLAQQDPDQPHVKRCAVVTHGGVIRAVLGHILKLPMQDIWTFDVQNVSSLLLSIRHGSAYIAGMGLSPRELLGRSQNTSTEN